jgi:two-component system, NtrC family, sensor kinase
MNRHFRVFNKPLSYLQHDIRSGTSFHYHSYQFLNPVYREIPASKPKDKSFGAHFKTDLDPSLSIVNGVVQGIGRVVLNLINTTFYAVSVKSKCEMGGYEPSITIRTRHLDHSIEIRVKDKSDGIPASVINKIFQPFFTTKPTGEGTGLGLSLSYDIITKGHGGSLEVDTTEGVGSEFTIKLPIA